MSRRTRPPAPAWASQFGAGLFVLGDLVEVGGEFQITAELYESRAPSRPIAEASVEGTNAFELVDELATSLLAGVEGGPGARVRRHRGRDHYLARGVSSLPYRRIPVQGRSVRGSTRGLPGSRADRQPVRHGLLPYERGRGVVNASEIEVAAAEKAYLHSSRLSDRDRRVLEAFLAWRRGAHGEAEQRYRANRGRVPH